MSRRLLPALLLLLLLSACGTMPSGGGPALAQRILDEFVPADFVGDFDGGELIPIYLNVTLKAGNLHKNAAGAWTFTWLEYDRAGPFLTSSHLHLGKRP